jgi:circadian clock protein KaiC
MADQPSATRQSAPERVPTGVPGLDDIFQGGLLGGASCLVLGEPGTGKTTLGNQLAYHHARAGGVALFVTVVAEAHDRMLVHLAGFDFFDPQFVGHQVHYLSLVNQLSEDGLLGALAEIRRLVRAHQAKMLIIDGAARFEDFAGSQPAYRRFVAELIAQLAVLNCTTVLLAQPDAGDGALNSIGTLVDAIVLLEDRSIGVRDTRLLRVLKLRGSATLRGRHEFAITERGVEIYPRLEAAPIPARPTQPRRQRRFTFGIDGLDAMLGGGVLSGSTTLVAGPPGIGKTTLGLHFIAEGAHRGERGMVASFGEAPERLIAKADSLGLDFGRHVAAGQVQVRWQPTADRPLDAWVGELLAAVTADHPQCLVIDGLSELAGLATFPERLPAFLSALGHALRAEGVATLITAETPTVEETGLVVPLPEAAGTLDNAILLRYVEPRSRLHRLISILRVHQSGFDPGVREFTITNHGIEVASTGASAESVLADVTRLPTSHDRGEGDHQRSEQNPAGEEPDHAGASEDSGRG